MTQDACKTFVDKLTIEQLEALQTLAGERKEALTKAKEGDGYRANVSGVPYAHVNGTLKFGHVTGHSQPYVFEKLGCLELIRELHKTVAWMVRKEGKEPIVYADRHFHELGPCASGDGTKCAVQLGGTSGSSPLPGIRFSNNSGSEGKTEYKDEYVRWLRGAAAHIDENY